MSSDQPFRVIRLPEVLNRTSLKRDTMYRMIRSGVFPKPVKIAARAVAWPEAEIDQWLRDRAASRQPLAACASTTA